MDIGLPHCRPPRLKEARERRKVMKENKKNPELERTTRLRTCTKLLISYYIVTYDGVKDYDSTLNSQSVKVFVVKVLHY